MNKERLYRVPLLILFALVCVALLIYGKNNDKEEKKSDPQFITGYQWKSPPMPDNISFAGEKVPLERWEIREQFDRQ